MSSCTRLFAIVIVLAGCGSKGKDKPAGDPAPAPPAAKPTDTAPPAGAAPAAATCNLIGKLELRQPAPAAGCGRDPRFAGFVVGLDTPVAAAAAIELDVTAAGDLADANVMIVAQSGAAPDAAGACAVTLKISDAGRADDDELYDFAIAVPPGGGAVKGEVVRNAPGAGGKDCITRSAVEGTFTPGGTAAAGAPMPDVSKMARAFASLDAYCNDTVAGFSKDACFSRMDQTDMCSCAPAGADDLQGNVTATGAGGHVKRAALVSVANAAADYVHCSLAVELSDGWHVHHKAFPCGAAPISHDGGIAVTINSFKVTRNGDHDVIALAWTQDDGKTKTKQNADCIAASATQVSCPFE